MAMRKRSSKQEMIAKWVGIIWIALAVLNLGILRLEAFPWRSICVMFMLCLAPFVYKSDKAKSDKFNIIDYAMTVVGIVAGVYGYVNAIALERRTIAYPTVFDAVLSACLIIGILIIVNRAYGKALTIIACAFLVYAYIGKYIPGIFHHRGYSIQRILGYGYSLEGFLGSAFGSAVSFVLLYIMFGNFLSTFGAGDFLMELSYKLMGRYRGGGAKVACLSSGLFGMISGSIVGNVVTTGSMTIPMMKRSGYKSHFAAAVEACSSSGGAIMPPVMGSTAFIMAEMTGIAYSDICRAAILPAVLFYFTLLVVIDLEALRLGLNPMDAKDIPSLKRIIQNIYFILPIVVLVFVMSVLKMSATRAAFYSIGSLLVIFLAAELVKNKKLSKAFLIDFGKKTLKVMEETSYNMLATLAACACAGMVCGVLNLSGMALKLSTMVLQLAGSHVWLACVLAMVIASVLGMGLPTAAAYMICAAVVAPALQKMGVSTLAANLFVMNFAVLSNVTPPVALGAYAAAGISKDNPIKVACTAFKLALVNFIVPFMYVTESALLLDGTPLRILQCTATSFAGAVIIAIAVQGVTFWKSKLTIIERVLFMACGFCFLQPSTLTDILGVTGAVVLIVGNLWLTKKNPKHVLVQNAEAE